MEIYKAKYKYHANRKKKKLRLTSNYILKLDKNSCGTLTAVNFLCC